MKIFYLTSSDSWEANTLFDIYNEFHHTLRRSILNDYSELRNEDHFPDEYDIGISFLYDKKIPVKELNKARWYNFHPGPLPQYGGRNIIHKAIMNGDKEFGVTLHEMEEDFDTGAIIDKKTFNIEGMTATEVKAETIRRSLSLAIATVGKIITNKYTTYHNKVVYYKKTEINDYIDLKGDIERQILALSCDPFYPKIKVGNKTFKVVPE